MVCGAVAIVRARAEGPAAGDAMMGAQTLLDLGGLPLSIISGRLVERLLQASCCGWHSNAIEYAQVMFNWTLLSLAVDALLQAVRKARSTRS
jgi:hypothetical protein